MLKLLLITNRLAALALIFAAFQTMASFSDFSGKTVFITGMCQS
jgi:hypothetical protein